MAYLNAISREHHRHRRKYPEGQVEPERVFHFKGPENKLDLKAHNLNTFVQIAEEIHTETWQFHLKRSDYSNWIRHSIKDGELAGEIEVIEKDDTLLDRESRNRIKTSILQKYTAPA